MFSHRRILARPYADAIGGRLIADSGGRDDGGTSNRLGGPIFLGANGYRMDRYAADRTVKRLARRTGISKRISPHSLRHSFNTAASFDAGVSLRDVQEAASHADPRTTMRYDRARQSLDRHATYIVGAFVAGASRSS